MNNKKMRARNLCIRQIEARLDAIRFCLIAGRDAAGVLRFDGNDDEGLAAQLRHQLLLHRGEVGVQVHEKPIHGASHDRKCRRRQGENKSTWAVSSRTHNPLWSSGLPSILGELWRKR